MTHALPRDLSCPRIATRKGGSLELSRIVAGMWRMVDWDMTVQQRVALIEQCIAMGVTSFDHADIYGNYGVEGLFGEALRAQPSLRERMELVSKCGIKLLSQAPRPHASSTTTPAPPTSSPRPRNRCASCTPTASTCC
jgi:predicted oxidoreductase